MVLHAAPLFYGEMAVNVVLEAELRDGEIGTISLFLNM
jgi:hypothetical protein